jgi:hypothetical protein
MAKNIIDISTTRCLNSQLSAEVGIPVPKQKEGAVLLVMDDPQAVYVYHNNMWYLWGNTELALLVECGLMLLVEPETDVLADNYDFVVCDVAGTPTGGDFEAGTYIKISAFFQDVYDADTTNILYEANEDIKILAFDTLDNITNQQLWVTINKQTIGFTSEAIVRNSGCDSRFREYFELNEFYLVQTSEGSGEYELYLVDDGTGTFVPFMVLKEGVTFS